MNEIRDWVVYLTLYLGDLMPRRYIGSSYQENIDNGYNGTVDSKDYKKIWLSERKNNPHLFKTRVLERGFPSQEAARTREGEIQRAYDVVKSDMYINKSYADGKFHSDRTGIKHTEESKAKMSASKTGRKCTAKTRAKISASMKGKKLTAETRAKMSASSLGKKHTAESKAKMSASKKGKNHPNADPTVRTIENPHATGDETKEFTGTRQEMLAEFPEMTASCLSGLLSGDRPTHLGWRLLDFSV